MSDDKSFKVRRNNMGYGIVPQSLIEDQRLSTTARVIGVWLCIQSENWELRVNQMRKALSIGKDADLAARKQLKEYGYLCVRQTMKADGVFGYLEWQFNPQPPLNLPQGPQSATVGGFSAAGSPAAGSAGGGQAAGLTGRSRTVQGQQKQPPPQATAAEPPSGGDLIFPGSMGEADRAACLQIMLSAGIDSATQQGVLDELQGTLRSGRTVLKPVGWVRRLVDLHRAGSLVFEYASEVAEVRSARAAHLARLASLGTRPAARPAAREQAGARPPLDLNEWRKRSGIPPRRAGQSCGLDGTSV